MRWVFEGPRVPLDMKWVRGGRALDRLDSTELQRYAGLVRRAFDLSKNRNKDLIEFISGSKLLGLLVDNSSINRALRANYDQVAVTCDGMEAYGRLPGDKQRCWVALDTDSLESDGWMLQDIQQDVSPHMMRVLVQHPGFTYVCVSDNSSIDVAG